MIDLEMVKEKPWGIRWIENPSIEVQLAAVEQNGFSIRWIENPSEEVQLTAVRRNIDVLKFTTQEFKELYPEYFF